jgi:hypothetical protein
MKHLILLILFASAFNSYGQGEKKSNVGVYYSLSSSFLFKNTTLEGEASTNTVSDLELGVNYYCRLTPKLKFESGISWHRSKVEIKPGVNPGIDRTAYYHFKDLLYAPIFLRYNLSKVFFVNGGMIVDVDISSSNLSTRQSGIGSGFGIGFEFPILESVVLQTNPYINFHRLVGFEKDLYPGKLFDAGIKIGLRLKD